MKKWSFLTVLTNGISDEAIFYSLLIKKNKRNKEILSNTTIKDIKNANILTLFE